MTNELTESDKRYLDARARVLQDASHSHAEFITSLDALEDVIRGEERAQRDEAVALLRQVANFYQWDNPRPDCECRGCTVRANLKEFRDVEWGVLA